MSASAAIFRLAADMHFLTSAGSGAGELHRKRAGVRATAAQESGLGHVHIHDSRVACDR